MTEQNENISNNSAPEAPRRRRPWVKILKIVFGTVAVLLLLLLLAVGGAVWVLTPERLTPMACGFATDYLNAEVKAKRIELSFWSTFPRLTVEVEDLEVISHALNGLSPEVKKTLPADADSLLRVARFNGGINVATLVAGHINLYDVAFYKPEVNMLQVDSTFANYDIVPPGEEKEVTESGPMPSFSLDRFSISGGFPIRYRSLPDSIDVSAHIAALSLGGGEAPVYQLNLDGHAGAGAGKINIPPMKFGLNGGAEWNQTDPHAIVLKKLNVSVGALAAQFDAKLRFADGLDVKELSIKADNIHLREVIDMVPKELQGSLAKIDTDLRATINAELLEPYRYAEGRVPVVKVDVNVPSGTFVYGPLNLSRVELDMEATIDGRDFNRSVVTVKKLGATGRAIDFDLSGRATDLMADPSVECSFDGTVNFAMLPAELLKNLPVTLKGVMTGKTDARFRQSWLNGKSFHKVRLDGSLTLDRFHMAARDGSMTLFTRHAGLKLGTSSSIKVNGMSVDSLLTASMNIDTVAFNMPGMGLTGSNISMGLGSRNIAGSIDTTRINPMGASLRAERLTLRSDSDSVQVRMRDAYVKGVLQRYSGNARSPLLKLDASLGNMRFADRYNRLSLRDAAVSFTLHPKKRPAMTKRVQAAYDSIAALHPSLTSDSIMKLTRRHLGRHRAAADSARGGRENIDFGIDNSLKSWLRLWQATGNIKAGRARMFTPFFPVRNRLSDLDIDLSTDSIRINSTRLKLGKSDFLIKGALTNISRALISKRGVPLRLELDVASDTLDINELASAVMRGSAFTQKLAKGDVKIADSDNDEVINSSIASNVGEDERAAFVVPSNITANVRIGAANVKYGDILFQRFQGNLSMKDGAVHLNRLGAFTPMGSLDLTALYAAPTIKDIQFACGLVVRQLDLHESLHMLPEVDSILPMLNSMEGIITAQCALTSELDSMMNFKFHTMDMAMKLSGDSLVLLDSETFRKLSKWLFFKNKKRNMIDSMSVEMMIRNSRLLVYPFMVDVDRYRFGISGSNDDAMNLDYHIAVLKSPIPFKFGVNIKGTPDHLKIRLGRARFNEREVTSSKQLTDTARVNLLKEIQNVFRFGVRNSKHVKLTLSEPKPTKAEYEVGDTLSPADSTFFIRQGVLDPPPGWVDPDSVAKMQTKEKGKGKKKKKR